MCESCEMLNINGVNCHELGCPDAWKDYKIKCHWCGCTFTPTEDGQDCCCKECAESYYN